MEIINKFDFKLKRRKLFLSAGAVTAAYFLHRIFPFRFGHSKLMSDNTDVIVKLNPKAVSRNKTGKNNV